MASAPALPAALLVAGGYLAWFGVHYWRSGVAYPTEPLKAVLTGKKLPSAAHADKATATALSVQLSAAPATASPSGGGGSPPSGNATHNVLEDIWTQNGGSPSTANIAASIAQAESSGNADSTSPNPDGGTNVGLWQLDTRGVGTGHTVDQLKDPNTNARITVFATANGTNWGPWETWHTGAYKKFMA